MGLKDYTDAFTHYGATLNNCQWSVSAFSTNGEFVISVWEDELKYDKKTKTTTYSVPISTWGCNPSGQNEFRTHLKQVLSETPKPHVRLIKAIRPVNHITATGESDRSKAKGFDAIEHLVGEVVSFNDDIPIIVFQGKI